MAEPTTLTGAGAAAKVAKWAWDNQDEIEGNLKKVYRLMRTKVFGPEPSILILGPGGVGKTTLGQMLSGKYRFLSESVLDYKQSVGVQTFRSRRKPGVEVIVAPGQEDRRNSTWPQLLTKLSSGKARGVIFCCAYGYHSLTINHKHHKLYKADGAQAFLSRFLPDRRLDEVKILSQITMAIAQSPSPIWMMTVVGKEDLWSPEEQEVREFYSSGAYAANIDAVMQHKGNHCFRHELVFGSLVIRNFLNGRGDRLASNVSGYDHVKQVRSLHQIFETVAALEDWKAS